jgi:hypothetical protein
MSLYYEDEYIELHHGDCRAVRGWTRADVLVTDPPYGMNFQSNHRRSGKFTRIVGDDDASLRDAVLELWPDHRPAIVFGRWSVAAPVGERQRVIWFKSGGGPGMGDLRLPWGPAHEDIHVLGDGWDVAATGKKRTGSVIVTSRGRGGPAATRTRSVTPPQSRYHSWRISFRAALLG